jgi:hypothetical protein
MLIPFRRGRRYFCFYELAGLGISSALTMEFAGVCMVSSGLSARALSFGRRDAQVCYLE